MNKWIGIGRVGKAPELRTTQGGSTVCTFSLATSEKYNGEEKTTWFRISAFGKLGEVCQKYLDKGRRVCVVGKVSASAYEGKDGKERASLEVLAESVEFLSPREEKAFEPSDADETANKYDENVPDDDFIPF
ncbi:MAG: single-stranded DNA-binding protein [Clostridia bacterium]|nr:single-stranded DNA-binding protein [Clostridia bacterium]